jgi:peptidoglycan/xylan/chitin deacetylase (PgdA/CDA1 family)/predicted MFS family arabinose efflux permease
LTGAASVMRLIGESLELAWSERSRPYLTVTFFVDASLVFVFLVALQSYLPEQYGGGTALPGYTLAAYGGAKLTGQLLAGRLVDRIGGRQSTYAGIAVVGIGQAALFLGIAEPRLVLPAAAIYGLGGALIWPALFGLAATEFETGERARVTSAMGITTGFGLAAGLGLGLVLPAGFPYAAAVALVLLGAAGAALAARSLPDQMAIHAEDETVIRGLSVAIRQVAAPRRIALSAIVLLQATTVGVLLAVFRAYGRDVLGVSFREELLILAPAAACGGGAVLVGGVLSDRIGRIPVLGVGFLIATVAIWGLSTVSAPTAVIPLAIFAALGLGLAFPSTGALTMDLSRTVGMGTLLGWFLMMEGIGHTIGPASGAWLNDKGGVVTVLWLAGALCAGIAVIALVPPIWTARPAAVGACANRVLAAAVKGSLVISLILPGVATFLAYSPSSQVYGQMIAHGSRNEMSVAITFDDGPNDPWTLRIADVLDGYGVKGTFFVVGQNAERNPSIVRELVSRGHLIGNHSYHHRKRDAVLDLNYSDLNEAEDAIARSAGVCPALYRPPNGFHTPWSLRAVSNKRMRTVTWDVLPGDWKSPAPGVLVDRVLDSVHPGSIIALHDGDDTKSTTDRSATLAALPRIIDGLRQRGYSIVRLDALLSLPPYLSSCGVSEVKS